MTMSAIGPQPPAQKRLPRALTPQQFEPVPAITTNPGAPFVADVAAGRARIGDHTLHVAVIRDVTARKEAEQRKHGYLTTVHMFYALMQRAPQSVVDLVTSSGGSIEKVIPETEKILAGMH